MKNKILEVKLVAQEHKLKLLISDIVLTIQPRVSAKMLVEHDMVQYQTNP